MDMNNVLIIDKPAGITSHDVVDFIRRKFGIKKVGHCGTLDPMATGVLVVLLNSATKLSLELAGDDKEYICTAILGISTDTQDATGMVIERLSLDNISEDSVRDAALSFKGRQKQIPPMISAKHYKGERLYKLARKGLEVEREPHSIEIKDIEVLGINLPEVRFRVVCSKGTYIRTLCHDMGMKLSCGAHMSALRRIRSGRFHIKDAVKLEEPISSSARSQ